MAHRERDPAPQIVAKTRRIVQQMWIKRGRTAKFKRLTAKDAKDAKGNAGGN